MPPSKRPSAVDEAVGRAWDALLAGEGAPLEPVDPDLAATIRQFHAVDDAPAPPAGLMERVWQDLAGDSVGLSVPGSSPAPALARPAAAPPGWWIMARAAAWSAVRALVIGAIAGVIVGAVVGGLGARVIMRIAAAMADPWVQGTITSEGQRVGEISTGGTIELMIFSGALFGIVGGVLYLVLRPCLPWSGFRRGLVFGLLLLGVLGSFVLDADNPDYRRIGSPELNVCLFGLLYVFFGALVAPLADRLDRSLLRHPPSGVPHLLRWLAWLGLVVFAALVLLGVVGTSLLEPPFGALIAGALIVRLAIGHWVGRFNRPADLLAHPRAAFATYAVLAIPCLAGLVITVRSISEILGAGA